MKIRTTHFRPFGFSTKEMLLALTLMTLIAALVVPLLLWSNSFKDTEDRRRAQVLVSISNRAHDAGVDFATSGELIPTLQNLMVGGQSTTGQRFQAFGMTNDEVQAAASHLRIRDGRLQYFPGGSVRGL